MSELFVLFEELLNENPNQAIKFLKDKKLDPQENPKGKKILDDILNITKGDGFTFLMTKFFVNEHLPLSEIQQLHQWIRNNKNLFNRLPKPIVSYETSRQFKNAADNLLRSITTDWLLKQLSPELRQQISKLSFAERQIFSSIAARFQILSPEKQRRFMKKVFGYKDVKTFTENIINYIDEVENQQDYESTKQKIEGNPQAILVYDDPEKEILIAHIASFEASKALGCTSAWCITRDIARFREYKSGGNYYFFIWDYRYPIKDENFFIATAYKPGNVEGSRTHEHIGDKQLRLDKVLSEKELSYEIFEKYIEEFKENRLKGFDTSSGLAKALQDKDVDGIIDMINNSPTIQEHQSENASSDWHGNKIYMGMNHEDMKEMLELGEEFDYIENVSSTYGGYDYYESEDADYMHGVLSESNLNLLMDLAHKLGVPDERYKEFPNKEQAIRKFLEEYELDSLVELYVSDYADAKSNAEQNAASELLDKIPFNMREGSFFIGEMLEYYIQNELTADNFEDLIAEIKNKLPDYTYDSISEAQYMDIDTDQLNINFKEKIEEIIDEIESDEDNEYYETAKMLRDTWEILHKLGFKPIEKEDRWSSDKIAILETPNSTIIIINKLQLEDSDEDGKPKKIMVTATVQKPSYKDYKQIKVPITSLGNYIDQLDIPGYLQEQLMRMKRAMGVI